MMYFTPAMKKGTGSPESASKGPRRAARSIHEHWMRIAIREAMAGLEKDCRPVGAVIVRDGRLLASAHDSSRPDADPTAHAEIRALRIAARESGHYQLPGATVYTTLEPCPMCAAAIIWARADAVVFGAKGLRSGGLGTVLDLREHWEKAHGLRVVRGILRADCERIRDKFL